jgi:hypothetical protein
MSNMSKKMLVKPTSDMDHDFAAMMIPHHQGAIEMARAELQYGRNEELRQLARNIVAQQEREISIMRRAIGEAPQAKRNAVAAIELKPEFRDSASRNELDGHEMTRRRAMDWLEPRSTSCSELRFCDAQFNGTGPSPVYMQLETSECSDASKARNPRHQSIFI